MDQEPSRAAPAQHESRKFRIERWILLTLIALACISAVASFFVNMGTNPKVATAVLLSAPSMALSLYRKPGRLARAAALLGGALFLWAFLQWLWQR